MRNVLFVGAHPDDIELGCLGSIMYFLNRGDNVYCIVASNGEKGNPDTDKYSRKTESLSSLTCAGVKPDNIQFLQLSDRQISTQNIKIIDAVENMCNEKKISYVFLQTDLDTHQDHKALHAAALSGARNVNNVLTYESSSSTITKFSPNYFIDITPYISKKVELLNNNHKSQSDKLYMEVSRIEGLARYRASQSRNAQYAEAFEVFRVIRNGSKNDPKVD